MPDYSNILSRLIKGIFITFIMALALFFFLPSVSDPITGKERQISIFVGFGIWILSGILGFGVAFRGFKNINK